MSDNEPSVSEDITSKSLLHISCPAGHVMKKLTVSAGRGRSWKRSDVTQCQGQYTSLHTSINKCLWRRTCSIPKSPRETFTSVPDGCLALLTRMPHFISVRNQQCIPKENVIDMCDHSFKWIRPSQGIIKSHSNYPWHYRSQRTICRKKIRVDRMSGLRMYTESIDLATNTRGDNIKFFHLTNRRTLVKKLVGHQQVDLKVRSGIVVIVFRVSRRSIGGQGFILRFEPLVKQYGEIHDSAVPDITPGRVNAVAVSRPRKNPCSKRDRNRIRAMIYQERRRVRIPQSVLCKKKISKRNRRRRRKQPRRPPLVNKNLMDVIRKASEENRNRNTSSVPNWAVLTNWNTS